MNETPKVSVLMITYNHEDFIAQAIESVMNQKADFDFELVIGEDCSTDSTREIATDYQRRYPESIRLITRKRNVGAQKNWEDAFAACRGSLIATIDGDDFWCSDDKLACQAALMDSDPTISMCFTSAKRVDAAGRYDSEYPRAPAGRSRFSFLDILRRNFIASVTPMFRAKWFSGMPEWKWQYPDVPGDWLIYLTVAQHGDIAFIDETMGARREHDGGEWSKLDGIGAIESTLLTYELIKDSIGQQYVGIIDERRALTYLEMCNEFGKVCDTEKAKLALRKACLISKWTMIRNPRNALRSIIRSYFPTLARRLTSV